MDIIFEVADLGDVLAHPHITIVKNIQLLANYSSRCLLPSLQSSTPIQTEHSGEGG